MSQTDRAVAVFALKLGVYLAAMTPVIVAYTAVRIVTDAVRQSGGMH